jgi:predicted carbohydrate-binding protein with CBM5 and CBM33 domain
MSVKKTLSIPVEVEVKTTSKDACGACGAYTESLKMILQHVADFHMTVVDIISEKYNIPVDEIINTVTSDSRYTNMLVDPKIHRLTSSSNQNQVELTETIITTATTATTATITATQLAVAVTKKPTEKKIRIKPKNSIVIPSSSS